MEILPDILKLNLEIVFCGMAAGPRSAKLGIYYAEIGNKFWKTLFEVGLTSIKLYLKDYRLIVNYNLGLTDLVKNVSGNARAILPSIDDITILKDKILSYQPRILAFNGKESANCFVGHKVEYG